MPACIHARCNAYFLSTGLVHPIEVRHSAVVCPSHEKHRTPAPGTGVRPCISASLFAAVRQGLRVIDSCRSRYTLWYRQPPYEMPRTIGNRASELGALSPGTSRRRTFKRMCQPGQVFGTGAMAELRQSRH
jgi:hypothetical protein